MGKVDFTPQQKIIVGAFKKESWLTERFYFTGGTALSVFHLGHRLSDDLDFFSEEKFDPRGVIDIVQGWANLYGFEVAIGQVESMLIFRVEFGDGGKTKIDFDHYPYRRVRESEVVDGIAVDSLLDIAINKLLLINQRMDVKDFVDLYFLKGKIGIWDLLEGVKQKFGFELDPILVAADFMKVEEFDFLPKMVLPLTVSELQNYFREKARSVSEKFIEE